MNKLLVNESTIILENYKRKEYEYQYRDLSMIEFDPTCGITHEEVDEFIHFLDNTHKFSLRDIRYRALLPALKYGFSVDSFWKYIQKKRKIWKT